MRCAKNQFFKILCPQPIKVHGTVAKWGISLFVVCRSLLLSSLCELFPEEIVFFFF